MKKAPMKNMAVTGNRYRIAIRLWSLGKSQEAKPREAFK